MLAARASRGGLVSGVFTAFTAIAKNAGAPPLGALKNPTPPPNAGSAGEYARLSAECRLGAWVLAPFDQETCDRQAGHYFNSQSFLARFSPVSPRFIVRCFLTDYFVYCI